MLNVSRAHARGRASATLAFALAPALAGFLAMNGCHMDQADEAGDAIDVGDIGAPAGDGKQPVGLARPGMQIVGEEVASDLHAPAYDALVSQDGPVLAWELSYPGATYISPHFSRFDLPKGAHVVVRSPDGSRARAYEGRGKQMDGAEGFWGMHVRGDLAIVELHSDVALPAGAVVLDRFARGLPIFDDMPTGLADKAICGSDESDWAKCYQTSEPEIYNKARAVARLMINGTGACTGWLVGSEGHLMTNEHCIGSAADAANTDYEFMAEGATCGTDCSTFGGCPGTVVADTATLVKLSAAFDYALVKLPTNPTATHGFLQLRDTGAVLNERIYIPQHPAAWGKKIAVNAGSGFATVTSTNVSACAGVGSDVGYMADTQGGSSGSPVLGYADHLVVSLHHCANCPNRGVPIQAVITDLGAQIPADAIGDGGGDPDPCQVVANAVDYAASDVPLAIPDDNSTGITSNLSVPDAGVIGALQLSLDITHTYRGDLVVTLISPSGTAHVVHNRGGGSTDNLVLTGQSITAFDGQSMSGTWKLRVQDLARADVGTLNSWSLTITTAAAGNEFSATDVPLSIPDNNSTGVTSQNPVSLDSVVEVVKLSLRITHTYRGDLRVTLISPAGTELVAHDRAGGSTDNLDIVDLSISTFAGENSGGTWRLKVQDLAGADVGTLDAWSVEFAEGGGGC